MSDFRYTQIHQKNYYRGGGLEGEYRYTNIEASKEVVASVTHATTTILVELIKMVGKVALCSLRRNPYSLPP
jgi:hypothetical protein